MSCKSCLSSAFFLISACALFLLVYGLASDKWTEGEEVVKGNTEKAQVWIGNIGTLFGEETAYVVCYRGIPKRELKEGEYMCYHNPESKKGREKISTIASVRKALIVISMILKVAALGSCGYHLLKGKVWAGQLVPMASGSAGALMMIGLLIFSSTTHEFLTKKLLKELNFAFSDAEFLGLYTAEFHEFTKIPFGFMDYAALSFKYCVVANVLIFLATIISALCFCGKSQDEVFVVDPVPSI